MTIGSAIFALTIACIIGGYVVAYFQDDDSDDEGHGCPHCHRNDLRAWQIDNDGGRWVHIVSERTFICPDQDPYPPFSADIVPFPLRRHA